MKDLKEKYSAVEVDGFKVHDITTINHKPHPFVIGPKHVAFCADNYGGMLGDACTNDERFPACSAPGCYLTMREHTSNKVMAVMLTKNLSQEEAQQSLKRYVDAGMEDDGIEGFVFIESPEEFRIEED